MARRCKGMIEFFGHCIVCADRLCFRSDLINCPQVMNWASIVLGRREYNAHLPIYLLNIHIPRLYLANCDLYNICMVLCD